MEIKLETAEQQVKFINTCAEFVPYMEGDCAGLSPGNIFFQQSVEGLLVLKEKLPAHGETIQRAIDFYRTLAERVRGGRGTMYPRGSEVFGADFSKLDGLSSALYDIADTLEN